MDELKGFGIRQELLDALPSCLEIKHLTLIQKRCIPEMLRNKDVVAQAPTGSGKTLAFLLPTIEMLLQKQAKWPKFHVGALIIVPSRELATQVSDVARKLTADLPLSVFCSTGGKKVEKVVEAFKADGGNIVVGTPGRLQELLFDEKKRSGFDFVGHLKSLEMLILDETDRLLELGLKERLSQILHCLPKQRRTGLFSATQVEEGGDELALTGLRDPHRVSVSSDEAAETLTPSNLRNFYLVLPTEWKLGVLARLAEERFKGAKVLIFLPTCATVEYLQLALRAILPASTQLLGLHGKKKKQRQKIFAKFQEMKSGILVCTDVMGRGIDIPDIDWVVQLGPPRQTSWFVHRAGRTGRAGAVGNALILLAPSEEDYVDYLFTQTAVILDPLPPLEKELTTADAEMMSDKIRAVAKKDRAVLEKGTRAFVSFIQAYSKHDCKVVCPLDKLDAVGLLHAFGLLRVPKMPELCNRDLTSFRRITLNTAAIPFKDKIREKRRQARLVVRTKENAEWKLKKALEGDKPESKKKATKRPSNKDLDDINDDYRLMKKLKKGRLSKTEFEKAFK